MAIITKTDIPSITIEDLLQKSNAVIAPKADSPIEEYPHLVLTSGKHSNVYINLREFAGNPADMRQFARKFGELLQSCLKSPSSPKSPDVLLVGPETMGRSLAELTACYTDDIDYVWCKPDGDKMIWDPKLPFASRIKGKYCVIIDDLMTTSKTINQVADLIKESQGVVLGVMVVVSRDPNITAESLDVPWFHALMTVSDAQVYDPEDCPLCAKKVPVRLRPGHGHEWIKDHPDYPVWEEPDTQK